MAATSSSSGVDGLGYMPIGEEALGEGWDPFEDPGMLELVGELAMQSEDIETIEAWIEQAAAADLPDEELRPKRDRVADLRMRQEDARRRKAARGRLDEALANGDRARLREAIGDAARSGAAHPRYLDDASQRLEVLRRADVERLRQSDAAEAARRDRCVE